MADLNFESTKNMDASHQTNNRQQGDNPESHTKNEQNAPTMSQDDEDPVRIELTDIPCSEEDLQHIKLNKFGQLSKPESAKYTFSFVTESAGTDLIGLKQIKSKQQIPTLSVRQLQNILDQASIAVPGPVEKDYLIDQVAQIYDIFKQIEKENQNQPREPPKVVYSQEQVQAKWDERERYRQMVRQWIVAIALEQSLNQGDGTRYKKMLPMFKNLNRFFENDNSMIVREYNSCTDLLSHLFASGAKYNEKNEVIVPKDMKDDAKHMLHNNHIFKQDRELLAKQNKGKFWNKKNANDPEVGYQHAGTKSVASSSKTVAEQMPQNKQKEWETREEYRKVVKQVVRQIADSQQIEKRVLNYVDYNLKNCSNLDKLLKDYDDQQTIQDYEACLNFIHSIVNNNYHSATANNNEVVVRKIHCIDQAKKLVEEKKIFQTEDLIEKMKNTNLQGSRENQEYERESRQNTPVKVQPEAPSISSTSQYETKIQTDPRQSNQTSALQNDVLAPEKDLKTQRNTTFDYDASKTSHYAGTSDVNDKNQSFDAVEPMQSSSSSSQTINDDFWFLFNKNRYIGINRNQLASLSAFMREQFDTRWPNQTTFVMEYSYEVFWSYLNYLYNRCIQLANLDDSVQLVKLAGDYKENEFGEACIQHLHDQLNHDNCNQIYQIATKIGSTELSQKALSWKNSTV